MSTLYSRQDFDEEVRRFATETRKKTRHKVERIGWKLHISNDNHPCLQVSILNDEGIVLTRNVAI